MFAEQDGRPVGYTCYGPIALTAASFDLYWIAVDKTLHGRSIGRLVLERTEELIRQLGGRQVYIETSNRNHYAPTRGFYLRCGYDQEGAVEGFLRPRRRQGDLRQDASVVADEPVEQDAQQEMLEQPGEQRGSRAVGQDSPDQPPMIDPYVSPTGLPMWRRTEVIVCTKMALPRPIESCKPRCMKPRKWNSQPR